MMLSINFSPLRWTVGARSYTVRNSRHAAELLRQYEHCLVVCGAFPPDQNDDRRVLYLDPSEEIVSRDLLSSHPFLIAGGAIEQYRVSEDEIIDAFDAILTGEATPKVVHRQRDFVTSKYRCAYEEIMRAGVNGIVEGLELDPNLD